MPPSKMVIVSESRPLAEYKWGSECDAFVLVNNDALQVKLEQMPPHTEESLHHHARTQQFFYVLQGVAQMHLNEDQIDLKAGEGVLVEAGCRHKIKNTSSEILRFVVTSQPAVNADRIEAAVMH